LAGWLAVCPDWYGLLACLVGLAVSPVLHCFHGCTGWLAGWLSGWLAGSLAGWLAG
jgi:hypothetical protein